MHQIINFDKQLFLEINRHHLEWLDPVMLFFSSYAAWGIIALCLLIYVVCTQDKAWRWPIANFLFLCVITTNLLNQLIKVIVARPRPIHEQAFIDLIHSIESFDSSYSFFSAHSSSSFALAVFALLAVRKASFSIFVLFWAFMVAYSRIYVGKHYPFDVIAGILFGTLTAVIGWGIYCNYKKENKHLNKK
ncbi:MAG: phosphatase PAP2 family protein [Massilibacteroides sp.]|nr:phosphatase PAP2 family protein [Massilibacteroides sp.]